MAPLVPIIGSYHSYEWKANTTGHYRKLAQAAWAPIEYVYGNTQVDDWGCGTPSYESGRAALFTIPVGHGYCEIGYTVYRDFFKLVFDEMLGDRERLSFDLAE